MVFFVFFLGLSRPAPRDWRIEIESAVVVDFVIDVDGI